MSSIFEYQQLGKPTKVLASRRRKSEVYFTHNIRIFCFQNPTFSLNEESVPKFHYSQDPLVSR